ncbi:MAG: hypothetical protein F7B60_01725 [Desulfurococcales archaeon]|nr:hypothetical protein [Desulfurococcales archaeon]
MSSSMRATVKCRKDAVGLVKKLYRARKAVIVNARPPGGNVDLSPSWRTLTIYISPVFAGGDITDQLILSLILAYRKRRLARGVAEALAILSLAFIGSLSKTIAGPWYSLLYLVAVIASAFVAAYIIALSRRMTGKPTLQLSLASILLSDPLCKATVESVKQLLYWGIIEKDKDVKSDQVVEGRLRWPRRIVSYNHYRDIVKKYPALISIVGVSSERCNLYPSGNIEK